MDAFNGTYLGIGSATARFQKTAAFGYSKPLASNHIARIRTDLDPFSPNEVQVLLKHGYELAEVAINVHAPELKANGDVPLRTWPKKLSDEALVEAALRGSKRRRYIRLSNRHHNDSLLS